MAKRTKQAAAKAAKESRPVLDLDAEILVKLGQSVKGGSSVLARWTGQAAIRSSAEASSAEMDANLTASGKRS